MSSKYLGLGILFSVLFLVLAMWNIELGALLTTLKQARLIFALPFLLATLLFFLIKAERWRVLLMPVQAITIRQLAPSMMIGVAINYMLFGYLGELLRVYLLGRQLRISKTAILATVLSERLLDGLTLLFLLGLGWVLAEQQIALGYLFALLALGGLVVFSLAIAYGSETGLRLLNRVMRPLSESTRTKILRYATLSLQGFHALAKPSHVLRVTLLSLIIWLCMASCNYLSMIAVGIHVPFYATFITMALVVLGVMLPNMPGHVGVVEFCYVVSLAPFGVPASEAFAAALFFHIFLYLPVILISPWFFRTLGLTLSKATALATHESNQGDPLE